MASAHASTPTTHASRYLQQLAKHWGHKFPVEHTPEKAAIHLPLGRCDLAADDQTLTVDLAVAPDADMDRFKTVVAEHLQRFAHRETLAFAWRDAD